MAAGVLEEDLLTDRVLENDGNRWLIGPRLAVKPREQTDPWTDDATCELHEVYEAVFIDPPYSNPEIMKIKKQIVPWTETKTFTVSNEIHREIDNLHYLTTHGCTSTPKLWSYSIQQQGPDDPLPGGYAAYISMERVPGKDLRDFGKFDDQEKNRVRLAFVEALWELHSYHFTHYDPRLPNIIWDSTAGKCYIVDLEDAERSTDLTDSDVCLEPWSELEMWGLIERQQRELTIFFHKEELLRYLKTELGM
ncbi:hypothetical protein BJX63DRAFT_436787 [Aspergillus granulosus]|uniref:Protein kinase domain-containing protein n=1 Tax=Aspergillus granulosus TaxID=176169 RepID=A0ABR4GX13_9EURO